MEVPPMDIVSAILSRVIPDSILTCKLVCKSWNSLLSNIKVGVLFLVPSHKQLGIYYGDFHELIGDCSTFKTTVMKINHIPIVKGDPFDYEMVGSCNGLVCLSVPYVKLGFPCRFGDPIYICNPVTREYVYLPDVDRKVDNITGGFGYLRTPNKYKVVRIYYPEYPGKGFVQIYTLGDSSGWREIGEIEHALTGTPGVLANETLYYMDTCRNNILALDLASEEFCLLPTPPCLNGCITTTTYQLKVMRGHLCIVHSKKGEKVDIWSFSNRQKDKIGGLPFKISDCEFYHNILSNDGLLDLGFKGYAFTWNNHREKEANIQERLDRAVANLK
ncbi:F-box protein At3g07870-like [Papaver somniferum]|uniref:F-box protein At3g07870-like n=1 Tax=Papaver somniferum TaxID=3469 RepID=UPI000E6F4F26|nr:F-box protein At3g07870-like [Papaver somniferum]